MNLTDYPNSSFDLVRRGYDPRQVDERLRFLGAELAAAEQALGSAQERAASAEDQLKRMRTQLGTRDREPSANFGERVERILRLAEEEAEEVRTRAAEQATETVRAARAEAERLVTEATAAAQRQQQEAQRELQRLTGLWEEVQSRLLGTRSLLDEYLKTQDQPTIPAPGRAADTATMRMEHPDRHEETNHEPVRQAAGHGPALRAAEPRQGPRDHRQGGTPR